MRFNKTEASLRIIIALITIYVLIYFTTENMLRPKGEKDLSAQTTGIYFAVVITIGSIIYNILNGLRQFKGKGIRYKGLLIVSLIYSFILATVLWSSHPKEIDTSNYFIIFIDVYII